MEAPHQVEELLGVQPLGRNVQDLDLRLRARQVLHDAAVHRSVVLGAGIGHAGGKGERRAPRAFQNEGRKEGLRDVRAYLQARASMPLARRAWTWSSIRAISGETTRQTPSSKTPGSW